MSEILFQAPSRLLHGANEINRAGIELNRLGQRVLLISDVQQKDALWRLQSLLETHGAQAILFHEPLMRNETFTLESCLNIVKGSYIEAVVAFGGNGALGLGRSLVTMFHNYTHPDELFDSKESPGNFLPYIEIPHSFFTPHILNSSFPLIDSRTQDLRFIATQKHPAHLLILDPVICLGQLEKQRTPLFFSLIMNSLSLCCKNSRSFLSDVYANAAFKRIWSQRRSLVGGWSLDVARSFSEAGLLCSRGQESTELDWSDHFFPALAAFFKEDISVITMVLLPYVLDYYCENHSSELQQMINQMEISDLKDPSGLTLQIRELIGSYSMPSQLRAIGIEFDALALAAEQCSKAMTWSGIGGITVDSIYSVLKNSW